MVSSLDIDKTSSLVLCIWVAHVYFHGQIVGDFCYRLDLLKLLDFPMPLLGFFFFCVCLFSKTKHKHWIFSFSCLNWWCQTAAETHCRRGEGLYLHLLFCWVLRAGCCALGAAEFRNTSWMQRPMLRSTNKTRSRMWNLFAEIFKGSMNET